MSEFINFMPILKDPQSVREPFIDAAQTTNMTETVLVGIALMVGAALFAILFMWAYQSGTALFIVIYSLLVLAFTIEVVFFILNNRENLTPFIFQLYMGSTITMGLISFMFLMFFGIKYSRRSVTQQPTGYNP